MQFITLSNITIVLQMNRYNRNTDYKFTLYVSKLSTFISKGSKHSCMTIYFSCRFVYFQTIITNEVVLFRQPKQS